MSFKHVFTSFMYSLTNLVRLRRALRVTASRLDIFPKFLNSSVSNQNNFLTSPDFFCLNTLNCSAINARSYSLGVKPVYFSLCCLSTTHASSRPTLSSPLYCARVPANQRKNRSNCFQTSLRSFSPLYRSSNTPSRFPRPRPLQISPLPPTSVLRVRLIGHPLQYAPFDAFFALSMAPFAVAVCLAKYADKSRNF